MNHDLEREALAVLQKVLGLAEEARQPFLDSRCSGRQELRRRVDALLGAAPDSGSFPVFQLDKGGKLSDATPALKTAETHADAASCIGPYRLIKQLGEGGMGTVYLAEQSEPVQRRVALKVVKLGMDSKQVLARFEIERQALAAMSHPAIARVFDAGITESGQPYFVMELVEGTTLCDYCDQHRLSLPQRLNLFQQICEGVQHAHQKGVIHRDLKPNNVLVVTEGKEPAPKIVDFGLAKVTGRDVAEVTQLTENHQVLGTFEYMSPEQARAGSELVDARADIYSLGVILYELLSGELPFPTEVLRKAGHLEALRLICDEDPAKPSAQLARRSDSEVLATQRHTSTRTLLKALHGDLDWIVLKAIAKEPGRRYSAATVLAEDLQRYLEFQPVLAGPPSAGYRLKKFVRRYRGQVLAACAVLVTALAGTAVAINYAFVANARADTNAKLAEENGDLATAEAAANAKAQRQQKLAEDGAAAETAARKIIESNAYAANVQMAAAWLDLRRPGRVRQRLDSCPQHLRRWEWFWLDANSDNSLVKLQGHTDGVVSASLSPDGTRIVTASLDNTARVWDAATGTRVAELRGHTNDLSSAAFSPDGTRVVTTSSDCTARVWDAATGASIAELKGHYSSVLSASFSPDGTRIVTTSSYDHTQVWDNPTRVWDATTGLRIADFGGSEADCYKASFSPDGTRVVTTSSGGATVWDAANGARLAKLQGHTGAMCSASFSPDGTRIVTASFDNIARVWNAATGASIAKLQMSPASSSLGGTRGPGVPPGFIKNLRFASFSPDSTRILTVYPDNSVQVWDATTGASVAKLQGHTGPVSSASFSPDGARIVTASWDSTARVWNAATGASIAKLKGQVRGVSDASFSPEGTRIVAACSDRTARVWDVTTGALANPIKVPKRFGTVASASPDATRFVTVSRENGAWVWDSATGTRVAKLGGYTGGVNAVSFSPDNTRLVTTSSESTARIWDAATGERAHELRGHTHTVNSASFSPDGTQVVTASADTTARIWHAANGTFAAELKGHTGEVLSASFAPNGTQVVTASADNSARVWDAASGRSSARLLGHTRDVVGATFSPDGTRVVTASRDHSARLWDTATGALVLKLGGNVAPIETASFGPDNTRVVTTSTLGATRVWDSATGVSVAELKNPHTVARSALFSWENTHTVARSAFFSLDGTRIVLEPYASNTLLIWDALPYRVRFAERQQNQPWAHLRTQFAREIRGEAPNTWLTDPSLSKNRPNFIK